jgi:recombination protein RecT
VSTDLARTASAPTVRDLIEKQRDQLARALPNQLSADRFLRLVATELRTVDHLDECTAPSLLGAVMRCAQLGVEPGGPLGQAWILPFKSSQTGQYEATFILGYKGIITLAYRSDRIASIVARPVKEADYFDYELGLAEDRLIHRPRLDGERGDSCAWYGLARMKGGGQVLTVMGRTEIEEHRTRSKSPNSPAWKNDYDAMACKTVIRAMAPFLPLTAETARAVEEDDRVFHMTPDGDIVDVETGELQPPAGEGF